MENSILVINAGSSSLKFKMFVVSNMQEVFYGQIEGFGTNSPSFYIKDSATKNQLEHKVFNEESQSRDEIILEVINMVISFNKSYNIIAIGHRVVPVSYTHLDVYKRQVWCLSLNGLIIK